jgi:hypothetical protein
MDFNSLQPRKRRRGDGSHPCTHTRVVYDIIGVRACCNLATAAPAAKRQLIFRRLLIRLFRPLINLCSSARALSCPDLVMGLLLNLTAPKT